LVKKYSGVFMKIGGSIMILTGVVLFFDKLSLVITSLIRCSEVSMYFRYFIITR